MGVVSERLPGEPLKFLLGCLQNTLQVSAMKPAHMNRKISQQVKEENILQKCFAPSTSPDIAQQQRMAEDTEIVNSSKPLEFSYRNNIYGTQEALRRKEKKKKSSPAPGKSFTNGNI